MLRGNLTGIFGKLPAHGDFIYRDLPAHFINIWDTWLQGYVGSSREQLGDAWLEIYMTSPIWRFCLSEGVVDKSAWAGIMLPSVDRVGRYFPFSVVTKLPDQTNPIDFMCNRRNWFDSLEEAALRALDGSVVVDELIEELNDSYPMKKHMLVRGAPLSSPSKMIIKTGAPEQSPAVVLPFMLDACLAESIQSYSVWGTSGSNMIDPCMFIAKGLPPLSGIAAMLDGRWQEWQWQEPYTLKQ